MAQKIMVALEDDLDGGPADEAVRFGLGGTEYEIDLSTRADPPFWRRIRFITARGKRYRSGGSV